ncbi:DUF6692 family protein [Pelagibacterium xiamenense]|uniref:DUF6692 family protein n=1 Tax=Pelagibacterium xiamenense TaxID=2901140 RepID=UPI001E2830B2|nr:DUF6692 family protein [Pelagibacterium xiamenense]MCD7060864.1 DUF305 domain-containing protein [Pelagibacterium xiamenense]
MAYWRFAAMIATSTVVMFGLMYLNTFAFEHVFWSQTRAWMALVMGSTMAVVMLSFMLSMYRSTALNIAIFAGAAIVFAGALWLVRSQVTVGDEDYMSAMIPHHSIAIMTSKRAQISDPRVRKLADEIIAAQEREIAEMRYLIAHADGQEAVGAADDTVATNTVPASEALAGANIAQVDPAKLSDAELARHLGDGPRCAFRYTSESAPAFAHSSDPENAGTSGLVKLNGALVALEPSENREDSTLRFEDGAVRVTISAADQARGLDAGRNDATMIFEIGEDLRVGYGGYYACVD